jgi:signal transduction histidine kinase
MEREIMRSYWIWFSFLVIAWGCAITTLSDNMREITWRIGLSAVFFAFFFVSPLIRHHPAALSAVLSIAALLAIVSLWPESGAAPNLFPLLVFTLLAGEAAYRLPARFAAIVGILLWLGAMAPSWVGISSISPVFIVLYGLLNAAAFIVYQNTWKIGEEATVRNEALLSEYRKMKRQNVSGEQLARQEERAQVGRDIHDSVGHKLTALLMQLEVFRMQADEETANRVQQFKELARESLEETRNAVKALKYSETGGLSAILGLIRKLEAESFFRVNFSVRHGALSAPLSNTQSIAVFRAVQEALTNIMRHSSTRTADIMFEAPGGGVFRFEVTNARKDNKPFREGFGLRAMRDRIEKADGRLEVIPYDDRFVVRGTFSMVKRGEEE